MEVIDTSDYDPTLVAGLALVPFLNQCCDAVYQDENGRTLEVITFSFHCQPSFSFLVRFSDTTDPQNKGLPIFVEIIFAATEGE